MSHLLPKSLSHLSRHTVAIRQLGRLMMVGILAIALCFGTVSPYFATAQAAPLLGATAYEAGPIRQTRNPVSNENFNGGVEPSVLDRSEHPPLPEEGHKGLIQIIRDKLTGSSASSNRTPVDLKTQKNPTLERYTDLQK